MKNSTAYRQGFNAGLAGYEDRQCPYEGTELANDWLDGWYDSQVAVR